MVFVLVLFWVLAGNFKVLFAQNIYEVINKIQSFYKKINTIEAKFVQETTFITGRKEIRTGKLWIKKPGKFRWEYQSPEKFLIVSNGAKVFIYYPEDKEVLIYPSKKMISSQLALGFMNGKGNIKKDFKLESFKVIDKNQWKLSFLPVVQDNYIEKIILFVNPKTGEIKKFCFINTTGEKIKISFIDFKYNLKLKNSLFSFIPPKNSEVINAF